MTPLMYGHEALILEMRQRTYVHPGVVCGQRLHFSGYKSRLCMSYNDNLFYSILAIAGAASPSITGI